MGVIIGSYQTKHMAVQQEIKSQLAKLLATEDIVVEHKQVECAQFNVRSRVLILPLWEKASSYVYDMLVGHEVGHALFTPDEDWWLDYDIPPQFVNVVEDARIEKLMKRKYLGIAKSFYRGYNELYDQDYFELDGEDITNFNLADRANLYFKVGSLLPLAFSPTEKPIIDLINGCETFNDTLSAAEALYNFCKQEKEDSKEKDAQQDFLKDFESSGDLDLGSTPDSEPTVPDSDSSSPVEDRSDSTPSNDRVDDSDSPVVQTADALESKLQELVNANGSENEYIEVPQVNIESVIASNKEVHDGIDNYWEWEEGRWKAASKEHGYDLNPGFEFCDGEYLQFKKDAQKEVSYLVKEFECRKAASSYARASTSRTGVLSTEKLHTYRYNEDLFKKITTLPEGKNHGLVFILDWSGSMQYVLQDTLKQLYNLMWFCKKVQIPFEVYAFTCEWNTNDKDYVKGLYTPPKPQRHHERKEGSFVVDDDFNLMNLFSSKVNARTLEQQMINIWRIARSFNCDGINSRFGYPQRMVLSGTPLNEAIVSLHQIIPQFKKENNVEKVQCIILTDGEAYQLPYNKEVQRRWEDEPYLGCRKINGVKCFLRDRKLGKTYRLGWQYNQFTDALLTNLKDNFPSTNFIGIRVLVNRDAKQFMRLYNYDGSDKMYSEWRKNKSFTIKNSGYDAYFGLSSTVLSQDAEFDVDHDATKAQIKRAFAKSLKTKKLNKKVLGEFISLVA